MGRLKLLVACEFSGVVRDALRANGHDAWSCDLLPSERPGPHIQGDVLSVLKKRWDGMIAHPPCTFLSNAGVRWIFDDGRYAKMQEAVKFFLALKNAAIPKIAIENPIPHCYAAASMGEYDQTVQPWQFGHMESKRTCLWLKGLPLLEPTNDVREAMRALPKREQHRVHYAPPRPDRWKERSRTFEGIAAAMADQWFPKGGKAWANQDSI